ncbi:porin [Pragia fontium]|uniref:porin n=1 Tax=Pragia fontium TaxID=82985 RepID=UPI000F716F60|nr:porin [Pragia fontium]VEJ56542.1 Porin OmpC [Pragia fontium]
MKNYTLLVGLLPAIMVTGAVNAAELYNKNGNKLDLSGQIEGNHYISDDKSEDGDNSFVRFGLMGETQVNDQITGYGFYQAELTASASEDDGDNGSKTRYAYAGLKVGDAGSFDYGRNNGILYDVGGWTDVLPEFGGDSYQQTDVFMTQRAGNLATYRNKNFFNLIDGLDFAVQYQGRNDANDRNKSERNGNGWGMSTTYDLGMGLSLGAAYSSSERTNKQKEDGNGDRANALSTGLKYDENNLYLAALYAQTYNMNLYGGDDRVANKTQNVELVAQYQFESGLQPSLAWIYSKGKNLGHEVGSKNYSSEALANYIDVGANYHFNKNITAKVDYKINMLDNSAFTKDAEISTDDIVSLAIVYQF